MQKKLSYEKFSAEMHYQSYSTYNQGLSTLDLPPVSTCLPFYALLFPVCH